MTKICPFININSMMYPECLEEQCIAWRYVGTDALGNDQYDCYLIRRSYD